jgi:hypothetical protein
VAPPCSTGSVATTIVSLNCRCSRRAAPMFCHGFGATRVFVLATADSAVNDTTVLTEPTLKGAP